MPVAEPHSQTDGIIDIAKSFKIISRRFFDKIQFFQIGIVNAEGHAEKLEPRRQHAGTDLENRTDIVHKVHIPLFQQFHGIGHGTDVADKVMADTGTDQFRNFGDRQSIFHFSPKNCINRYS